MSTERESLFAFLRRCACLVRGHDWDYVESVPTGPRYECYRCDARWFGGIQHKRPNRAWIKGDRKARL